MTEYDYSPEAYERYMSTQQRIAQWVDQTEVHRPEFGHAAALQRGTPPPLHSVGNKLRRPSRHRSSSQSSSSSSDTYASSPTSPGPMPTFQPMHIPMPQQFQAPHLSQHLRSSSYQHSSSHRPSLSRRKSHHSPTYVITSPPLGQPYIHNGQLYGTSTGGGVGVTIIPPKGKVTSITSPPATPYYTSPPAGYTPQYGYPFPQTSHPNTGSAGQASFIYAAQPQGQSQQGQQTYPSTFSQQPQPQSQYTQPSYPPTIYPLTQYPYAQAPQQALPQVLYQRIYSGSGKRKGSGRSY